MFDYVTIENVKVNREVEEDETNEEKKVNDEQNEVTNKDIAILNQKIEKFEKDLQEITEEKLSLLSQNEKYRLERVKIKCSLILTYMKRKIWMKCFLIRSFITLWCYKLKSC